MGVTEKENERKKGVLHCGSSCFHIMVSQDVKIFLCGLVTKENKDGRKVVKNHLSSCLILKRIYQLVGQKGKEMRCNLLTLIHTL